VALSVARLCASWGLAAFPRTQRQDASNPFLQPTFRVTSTRDKHHLWRPPAERRGINPPVFDIETVTQARAFPPFVRGRRRTNLAVHPASSSSALDGAAPASGRSDCHASRLRARWVKSAAALSADGGSADSNPLTPLVGRLKRDALTPQLPAVPAPLPSSSTSNAAGLARSSRCLLPEKTIANALASTRVERCPPLASGGSHRTFSSRFMRTLTRPLFARFHERLPGRMRFYDFCKCMFPRARLRTTRTSHTAGEGGWDDCRPAESRLSTSFNQGQSPKVCRVRGREQPSLDAPHRDCSRWRLRPNPDRFGPPLVASIRPRSPVRNDVGEERCRQRYAPLQRMRSERVVRRPPSAKKTRVHQPEEPSVARPLASELGGSRRAAGAVR